MNSQYFDLHNDLPAWYVENSNSALLSVAAWQCGYPAICEVDVEKKHYSGERGRPPKRNGRVDLEIHINDSTYWVEAKRKYFSLSKRGRNSLRHSGLAGAIRAAWEDAGEPQKPPDGYPARRVAIVFFSAHFDSDAAERKWPQGSPKAREGLVAEEIEKMQTNMQALGQEMKATIHRAVFVQSDFGIHRGWQGYQWPAIFGMCAIIGD
jgi:hypothetical protein